jgi:hypothetical protein
MTFFIRPFGLFARRGTDKRVQSLAQEHQDRGSGFNKRPCLTFLIVSILVSCVSLPPTRESKSTRIIEDVPFYPQEIYQCGPASLAEVLAYWGVSSSPEEIADQIYSRSARGTLNIDLAPFVEKKGLKASRYAGSAEDLKERIESGFPLVVMVDYGFWVYEQNHYMTVFGYSNTGIVVHSGKEKGKWISWGSFLKSWEKTKYWTLLVTK